MSEQAVRIEHFFDDTQQHVGKVYAQALLDAAGRQHAADAVVEDLNAIVDEVFKASPNVEAILSNPRIDPARKSSLLDRLFGGKTHDVTLRFLKVLTARRRLDSLRAIARAARELQDQAAGRLSVQITTAQPLDEGQLHQLTDRLRQTFSADVRVAAKVDPKILGGLVVRVGDTLFDASVEGRLRQMQRTTRQHAEAAVRARYSELAS